MASKRSRLEKAATVVIEDDSFLSPKTRLHRTRSIPFSESVQSFGGLNTFVTVDRDIVGVTHSDNTLEKRNSSLLLPTVIFSTDSLSVLSDTEISDVVRKSSDEEEHQTYYDLSLLQPKPKEPLWRRVLIAVIVVTVVLLSNVGATQFTASSLIYKPQFYAPYFLTWLNTCWLILCFPICIIISPLLTCNNLKKHNNIGDLISEAKKVFGADGFTLKAFALQSVPFMILWIVANYSTSQALGHVPAGQTTAVFGSCSAFVFLLSWVFLHFTFVPLRLVAFLVSIIGIIFMAHAEGLRTKNFNGIIAAVIASAVAAIYKVLFIKVVGNVTFCQDMMFLTLIGVCNLILNWTILLALLLTETEIAQWSDVPWDYVFASAAFSLVYNFSLALGTAISNPLFPSIGILLSVPLNAAIDVFFRESVLGSLHLISGTCILSSFLLVLLPEDFTARVTKFIALKKPPDISIIRF